MAYDIRGRWIPSEDITWDAPDIRQQLVQSGLDWSQEGAYAFRTNAWGQMSESQRLATLQVYDAWYDSGFQRNLNDENWGLDLERGLTYNNSWDAQTAFHVLSGGGGHLYEAEGTLGDLRVPTEYNKGEGVNRDTAVGSRQADGKTYTTLIEREHPMDWKHYSTDELYRATIDEILDKFPDLFLGSGADFDNATQVRAANDVIKGWQDDIRKQAQEEGRDHAWAIAEWKKVRQWQIDTGYIANERYDYGRKTQGPERNQQVAIRKYKAWNHFDPETGTRTTKHPVTGGIRDEFTHKIAAQPTRMTVTSDINSANIDEGRFYSPTVGDELKIMSQMAETPPDISKPNLTIRTVKNKRPENIDNNWTVHGVE